MLFRAHKKKYMIYYTNSILENDLVLSIDGVVLDVSISRPELRDLLDTNIATISASGKVAVRTWQSFKPGTFRENIHFGVDEERCFWLGHGLNGNSLLIDRYRLDFNPNKVAEDPNFGIILEFLLRNSRANLCRVSRFDLAIDIPVDRSKCFLVKDRRLYIERKHGQEYTQYLGSKSSTVGRVKLYNKTLEADLDYPLTRLELTLDPKMPYEKLNFPAVWCLCDQQITLDGLKVTETERFILDAILQGFGTLNDLGRKTRVKIEKLLRNYLRKIEISEASFDKILKQLEEFGGQNYERKNQLEHGHSRTAG